MRRVIVPVRVRSSAPSGRVTDLVCQLPARLVYPQKCFDEKISPTRAVSIVHVNHVLYDVLKTSPALGFSILIHPPSCPVLVYQFILLCKEQQKNTGLLDLNLDKPVIKPFFESRQKRKHSGKLKNGRFKSTVESGR